MKKFKLFWEDGRTEMVSGFDVANAIFRAGYTYRDVLKLKDWEEIK